MVRNIEPVSFLIQAAKIVMKVTIANKNTRRDPGDNLLSI